MYRIFTPGRKVFISKPINHFEPDETALETFLMGGGIVITPMISFAHRLYALNKDFEMHYSLSYSKTAGYLSDLASVPWANRTQYHYSQDGARADFAKILRGYEQGWHVYLCGPYRYMKGVVSTAEAGGFQRTGYIWNIFRRPICRTTKTMTSF